MSTGRPPTITEQQIRGARECCDSVQEMAEFLEVSVPSIYYWLKKLSLPTYRAATSRTIDDARAALDEFASLNDTVKNHGLASRQAASRFIERAMFLVWDKDQPPFPIPERIYLLPVANSMWSFQTRKLKKKLSGPRAVAKIAGTFVTDRMAASKGLAISRYATAIYRATR